jgi:hypothetical protein
MRFQFSVIEIGITGWMLVRWRSPSSSAPILWSKLYSNGTLISSAIGFCSFFASDSSDSGSSPARAPVTVGPTDAVTSKTKSIVTSEKP